MNNYKFKTLNFMSFDYPSAHSVKVGRAYKMRAVFFSIMWKVIQAGKEVERERVIEKQRE